MVSVFCSWIIIGFSAFLWGAVFTGPFLENKKEQQLALIMFSGLCALTVYSEFFSLFAKVGLSARILMLLADIAFLFFKRNNIRYILESAGKSFSWWKILWAALSCIIVLPLASSYIINSDTYLYHAQCIRWIEEYGVVKGIGNLHSRIAFNSSFLCLQALFSFREIAGQSMHSVNGFVAWLMLTYAGTSVKAWKHKKIYISDGLRLSVLFFLNAVSSEFSSPGTDLMAHCLTFYIFIEWISGLEEESDQTDTQALLSILSVYALTLKLSAALLILFAIIPAIRLIKEKQWSKFFSAIIAGLAILLPFCWRNVIISGYLIYPMEQLDLFSFDWKMPAWICRYERQRTKAWAEGIFGKEDLSAPVSVWFPFWKNEQRTTLLQILCADAVICLSGMVITLSRVIRKNDWRFFPVCAIMSANLLYWFLSAPHIRFGRPALLIPLFFFIGITASRIHLKKLPVISVVLMCLLMCYPVSGLLISARAEERHFIRSVDYEIFDMTEYPLGDFIIYIPSEGAFNGYYEFPAVLNLDTAEQIELRGTSLADGFRVSEKLEKTEVG